MSTISRTSKEYYEEVYFQNDQGQLYEYLFTTDDTDTVAAFTLDKLLTQPYGVSYRDKNTQSVVRPYNPGTGQVIEPPRASEKTPISEELRDAVAVGVEETQGFNQHHVKMVADITKDHIAGHNMTKNRQALDVFVNGSFFAKGVDGDDLDLDIDFSRDASLTKTYDFTAGEASFSEAVKEMLDACIAKGMPKSNVAMIAGSNWQSEWDDDTFAQEASKSNQVNQLIETSMVPGNIAVEGLQVLGRFRTRGMRAAVWVLDYSPEAQYQASKNATPEDFLDADKAIMFSLTSTRYNVKRGVDVFDDNEKPQRVVGDMVMDTFTEKDPITEFFRSQTRHAFIPANINHTAVSTGTFA